MQVNAKHFHHAENARKDQGDTECDDQARTKAQTEKADDEDDDNGFPQSIDKSLMDSLTTCG